TDDEWVDIEPSVSPDGQFAVFASDRGGNMDLWKVSLPGGVLTQLTLTPARDHAPAVSPDGRTIAFLETDGVDPRAPSQLRVMPAAGGSARTVTTGLVGAAGVGWDGPDRIAVALRTADGRDAGHVTYDAASGAVAAPRSETAATAEPRPLPEIEWRAAAPGARRRAPRGRRRRGAGPRRGGARRGGVGGASGGGREGAAGGGAARGGGRRPRAWVAGRVLPRRELLLPGLVPCGGVGVGR